MVELVIKVNENEVRKECGLCGNSVNFRKGPQLFRADNWKLVCDCGGSHAPELYEIIPEVRDFLRELDYLESMDRLREFEAKGEDIFPF